MAFATDLEIGRQKADGSLALFGSGLFTIL
jgi:hypothetical protein